MLFLIQLRFIQTEEAVGSGRNPCVSVAMVPERRVLERNIARQGCSSPGLGMTPTSETVLSRL